MSYYVSFKFLMIGPKSTFFLLSESYWDVQKHAPDEISFFLIPKKKNS